ncbi:hypothetical protein FB45DRAFT_44354 [Roridomyces roridus]|uniref:Uncharacterized protein n=1 Tax=Roridomyces roridus TaxID=1738132 RepID=A0AAD7FK15_9AGAR|nr:hypothetical protein FB45DRAFT_44354 [Roridomyces roridus]
MCFKGRRTPKGKNILICDSGGLCTRRVPSHRTLQRQTRCPTRFHRHFQPPFNLRLLPVHRHPPWHQTLEGDRCPPSRHPLPLHPSLARRSVQAVAQRRLLSAPCDSRQRQASSTETCLYGQTCPKSACPILVVLTIESASKRVARRQSGHSSIMKRWDEMDGANDSGNRGTKTRVPRRSVGSEEGDLRGDQQLRLFANVPDAEVSSGSRLGQFGKTLY